MGDQPIVDEVNPTSSADLHRAAGTMVLVRWFAVPWVLLQILAYEIPYPPGKEALAFALLGVLTLGNAILMGLNRSPSGLRLARPLAVAGLALDVFLLSGFVWLYAFDYQTQIWAVLFIAPLEGAIFFQLPGALIAWAAIAISYALRDAWAADTYGNPLIWNAITFRMGVGGIIALVAGLMARDLVRQRQRLADALVKIERIDRMRAGLVSTLGHDVRSPLTVIRGVVSTLQTGWEKISLDDRTNLLASADRQAKRLETLANDLLDLARLDQGRLDLEPEPVAVDEIVRGSLSYVDGGDQILVAVDEGLRAMADPRRFEQVVINLASNALRHGALPVSISATANNGYCIIEVTDHGPGVPETEIESLFQPFSAGRKTGSVGYGLAIVKALVEAQDGSVAYSPAPQGGASFKVVLPRA